jgi:hypothetical protein
MFQMSIERKAFRLLQGNNNGALLLDVVIIKVVFSLFMFSQHYIYTDHWRCGRDHCCHSGR